MLPKILCRMCLVAGITLASGCVRTTVMPFAADTVQITTSAAPACGPTSAQRIVYKNAAITTINRGYDLFEILSGQGENNIGMIEDLPKEQAIVVRMFHVGEPGAEDALSARDTLGPQWQQIAAQGYKDTCI